MSRRIPFLVILLVLLTGIPSIAEFYTDWLWFREVGYEQVFFRSIYARATTGALTGVLALQGRHFSPGDPREGVIVLPVVTLPARPYRPCPVEDEDAPPPLFRYCGCGDPGCQELTRGEFAPGHDAKRKSMLWRRVRDGQEAIDELRRRGWEIPPEMR